MIIFLEIEVYSGMRVLLAGVPESIGVLVFGLGLIAMAVLIRRILKRGEVATEDKAKKV
jgi:hypothetical protein